MKTFILIFILGFYTTFSFAGSKEDSIVFRSLLLHLEHQIWLSQDEDSTNVLLFQKSRLLLSVNLLEPSLTTLNRIKINDNNSNEVYYQKALVSFLLGDFSNAYNQLLLMPNSFRLNTENTCFLWLLTLSELNRWEECKQLLYEMSIQDSLQHNKIGFLATQLKYKSPDKAFRLSSYMPGLGQIYTGHFDKGISSLLIHAGLIWFTAYQYASTCYITGTLAGIYPLARFYNGGRKLSYNFAVQYNDRLNKKNRYNYQQMIRKQFQNN